MFLRSLVKVNVVFIISMLVFSANTYADATDVIIKTGIDRQRAAAASQKRIDKIADDTDKIVAKYQQEAKGVESLKVYNDRLRRTVAAQLEVVTKLEQSIENASLIERQIVPLMIRMIGSLEEFIDSDLPFKLQERKDRLERIKSYLTNANISAAERFRKVLEAYSIENNYGSTVDVFPEILSVDGVEKAVNILQLGRSVIYYQTLDEQESGYFDTSSRSWSVLDSSHNSGIARAIKVAQKKISPELMLLPIPAPEGA